MLVEEKCDLTEVLTLSAQGVSMYAEALMDEGEMVYRVYKVVPLDFDEYVCDFTTDCYERIKHLAPVEGEGRVTDPDQF